MTDISHGIVAVDIVKQEAICKCGYAEKIGRLAHMRACGVEPTRGQVEEMWRAELRRAIWAASTE